MPFRFSGTAFFLPRLFFFTTEITEHTEFSARQGAKNINISDNCALMAQCGNVRQIIKKNEESRGTHIANAKQVF